MLHHNANVSLGKGYGFGGLGFGVWRAHTRHTQAHAHTQTQCGGGKRPTCAVYRFTVRSGAVTERTERSWSGTTTRPSRRPSNVLWRPATPPPRRESELERTSSMLPSSMSGTAAMDLHMQGTAGVECACSRVRASVGCVWADEEGEQGNVRLEMGAWQRA